MSVAYVDSSALVKLVVREAGSAALRRELRKWDEMVSSELALVELSRAARRRSRPVALLRRVRDVLDTTTLLLIDSAVLDQAAALSPAVLRALDAIHLATAQSLGGELGMVLAYDQRMVEAAAALGLPIATPR